jgi:YidC/Oxa1 family membrane protein insertase
MKSILALILIGFVVFCGILVFECGLFDSSYTVGKSCILLQQTTVDEKPAAATASAGERAQLKVADFINFGADNAAARSVTLGSIDPRSGFKFQLELSSKGAAISKATFSEFDDRDYKDPQPLVILSPVRRADGSEILAMANANFVFVQQGLKLALDRLHWKSYGVEKDYDGSQAARFEAVIKDATGEPVVKLSKTYKAAVDSHLLDCSLTVENLSGTEQKVRFDLAGPLGLGREGVRGDMRKAVGGFRDSQGQVTSVRLDVRKLSKAKSLDNRRLTKPGTNFLWAAAVNKYFAAILVPVPAEGKNFCDWVTGKAGRFYNPDGYPDTGDETVGVDLKIASSKLAAVGQADSIKTYNFQLYLGPKDKSLFDKNELYRDLGFVQVIDFMPCFCCPTAIIHPLAFGILAVMKWMYGFVGNYGLVIIILVLLFRLAMHPITKKSQVSMSRMSKLAPKAEEIKKKYANNKAEMNKQIMALYREQGASPIMGFLPMMVQMPVWIALWSAVYASIELRGAPFLPFWITDLSVPDALVRFSTITVPMLGWKIESLNLLPILMGVAFYLQQKLMPSQAAANPQVAQQQKMMMIMMPLLFPLMLYKAPSGVNLYIMSSVFAGVIEQRVIKKHIREREEAESVGLVAATSKTGGKVKKKKPKPFYKM